MAGEWKPVKAAARAMRTTNPIRAIVDNLKSKPNPEKQVISLSIGDPTLFGNFVPPASVADEIARVVREGKHNGYPPSVGYENARAAVAKHYSLPEAPLTAQDVLICSGCSGALEICISALVEDGHNILLPKPGFSLYQTIAEARGMEVRYYNLLPERNWEVDLDHLRSLIDDKTDCILINNPSNPCGSNYSEQHLRDILAVAEEHHLPIIADEIYADMVFGDAKFTPLAKLSKNVPILSTGGIAKRFVVPGWRIGWILVHDRNNLLEQVRDGLVRLSQLILGGNSIIQGVLPALLESDQSYHDNTIRMLEENARFTIERLGAVPGLDVVTPQGAMYVMVHIRVDEFKDIEDDADFCNKLIEEQSVILLPGQCFKYKNYFRIVFSNPKEVLAQAYDRIAEFCAKHHK